MAMKLYELTDQYKQLLAMLEETDDPQCVLDTLESIAGDIVDKVTNIAKIKLQLDAEAAVIKEEADRLAARRKSREAHAERIKNYLEAQIIALGENIKTPTITVALQNNAPSIHVLDEAAYTEYTQKTYGEPQPPKVDARRVLEDMKAGAAIPGAEIWQTRSLRIR